MLKTKCWRQCCLVVGGVERDDDGRLSALLIGSPNGDRLRYEGRVEFALDRAARPGSMDGRVYIADGGPLRHAVAVSVRMI